MPFPCHASSFLFKIHGKQLNKKKRVYSIEYRYSTINIADFFQEPRESKQIMQYCKIVNSFEGENLKLLSFFCLSTLFSLENAINNRIMHVLFFHLITTNYILYYSIKFIIIASKYNNLG